MGSDSSPFDPQDCGRPTTTENYERQMLHSQGLLSLQQISRYRLLLSGELVEMNFESLAATLQLSWRRQETPIRPHCF